MSTDRGDAVDPNDPYRPAPPSDAGSTLPPGYDPAPSGHEASPRGHEGPGTAPYGQQGERGGDPGTAPYYSAQTPYGQPSTTPGYASSYPAPSRGTDGFAIASLVTGILGLAIVPLVLGIVAISRINRSGQDGKGLAIAGIVLGVLGIVGWLLVVVGAIAFFTAFETYGYDAYGLGALTGGHSPG
jgi:hypothetical protein